MDYLTDKTAFLVNVTLVPFPPATACGRVDPRVHGRVCMGACVRACVRACLGSHAGVGSACAAVSLCMCVACAHISERAQTRTRTPVCVHAFV